MDRKSETSQKRESSSESNLTKQLFRRSEKASVSGSKDTTTGPEGKPTEQKKEKGSPLRLSNGLEITQPLAKRFLERQRELQNEKMPPASGSKDTTTGPEKPLARSQSDSSFPKYKMTKKYMDLKRRLSMEYEKSSMSKSKDTMDPEKPLTHSQSEGSLPKHEPNQQYVERANQPHNEIQSEKEDKKIEG